MQARFVRDFVIIARPYPEVASAVRRDNGALLRPLAEVAHHEGEVLRVRLGPGEQGRFTKRFDLRLGTIQETTTGLTVETVSHATGIPGLFPGMKADLSISPLGPTQTYVSLDGRYRRPLGVAGQHLDDLLLHRVAERSIRHFLRHVARALEDRVAVDVSSQRTTRASRDALPA